MPTKNGKTKIKLPKIDGDLKNESFKVVTTTSHGDIIEVAAVESGAAILNNEKSMENTRLLVIPEKLLPDTDRIDIEKIKNRGGFEPIIPRIPGRNIEIDRIPDDILKKWFFLLCRVTGTVRKNCGTAGAPVYCPVPNAIVHICEVDKWSLVLERLPLKKLNSIRESLLRGVQIDKPELLPSVRNINSRYKQMVDLPSALKMELQVTPTVDLKRLFVDKFQIFHPYFCRLPWIWPWLYKCTEITTVHTDANGNFSKYISYHRYGDKPDVYVWVEYPTSDGLITVYRPNIPCFTRWNYKCGSQITITITDNRVPCTCPDLVGTDNIWMYSVGHDPISDIEQRSPALSDTVGNLTQQIEGLIPSSAGYRPYGGTLSFRTHFGHSFPTNNFKYFRWEYRQLKDAQLNPDITNWTPIKTSLHRPYLVLKNGLPKIKNFSLFNNSNELYTIPSDQVSDHVTPDSGETLIDWTSEFMVTAKFSTTDFNDGLYQFRMRLYNQAGNDAFLPVDNWLVTDPAQPGSGAVAKTVDQEFVEIAGGSQSVGFTFSMRIDNTPCYAEILETEIFNASIPPRTVSSCGFIQYNPGDMARIKFIARQENGFGRIKFDLIRGLVDVNALQIALNDLQFTSTDASSSSATFQHAGGGVYTCTIPVSMLTGGTSGLPFCPQASFAEVLKVEALHTNGYSVLQGYDAEDAGSFAIEPV